MVQLRKKSRISLAEPLAYLITRGDASDEAFEACSSQIIRNVTAAAEAGVALIQIREKNLSARLVFELTSMVVVATSRFNSRVLVNDRADIAFAAGAHGVHLTSKSLPARVVRAAFPDDFIVGVSTHTLEEVEEAANGGADFVVFGPIYETPSKPLSQGIDSLRIVCEKFAPLPILAIGGIDETNFVEILQAGAAGFASIRALNDPVKLAQICTR